MDTPLRSRSLRFVSAILSDHNLTKKAYLNALASMLEYGTNIVVGFLVTPFMVAGLGDYSYGLWQVLNRMMGYLTPASGRPTYALKWTLVNQQASDDYEQKRRYVGSTLVIWLLFLPVLLSLGSVMAWQLPGWIHAPAAFVWPIRIVCIVLVVDMALDTLASVPRTVLQSQNLGYKRMGLSALLIILSGIFTWLAVYFKTGIIGIGLAVLLAEIVSGLFYLPIARRYTPWFGVAKPLIGDLRQIFGRSWWFLAWNLVTSLLLASDVVVLGFFNSVASVTNYSLTKYVPEMMISVIANIVFAIMPGLGRIVGSGELRKAIRLRGEIMSLIWLVVTAMGASILLWNRTFLGLWVGPDRYSGSLAQLLIVVSVMQLIFIRSDANIIDLTLRLGQKVLLGLVSVTVSIVSASLLVGYFRMGIVGLCIGIIAGRLIMAIGYPMLIGRFLELPLSDQVRGMLRPMSVTTLLFGSAITLDNFVPTNTWPGAQNWIGFFLFAGVSAILILVFCFFAGLSAEQRFGILRRVRMLYSRDHSHTLPLNEI